MRQKKPLGRIASVITTLLLLVIVGLAVYHRQFLTDYANYLSYKPTAEIEQMVARIGFTNDGKFSLYSTDPSVDGADEFNQHCSAVQSEISVLGCYAGGKIYIYNVQNKDLDGIREVTLAHETLHAVYERLSATERERVDATLESYYASHRTTELEQYIKNYSSADRLTELHSVFGTEASTLPQELEAHYNKYFNRSKVLDMYENYHQKFIDVRARANEIIKEAEALANDVRNQSESYNTDIANLDAKISSFNSRASSGAFTSQSQFDAERAELAAESSRLEVLRTEINQKVDRYTVLHGELQKLELRNKELNDSINSKLSPAPAV